MPVNKHTQQSLIGSCGNVEYRNYTILLNSNISQHQTRATRYLNIIGYFIVIIFWLSQPCYCSKNICSKNENVCEAQVGFTPVSYCKSNT